MPEKSIISVDVKFSANAKGAWSGLFGHSEKLEISSSVLNRFEKVSAFGSQPLAKCRTGSLPC